MSTSRTAAHGEHPVRPGTWFVLPTAFSDDRSLDPESQRRVTEAALDWSADGMVAMGVTGEAAALAPDERDAVVREVVEAAGRQAPVVVGCSAGSAEAVVYLARAAAERGAAAAMVSAPPLHRDLDRLPGFFARVAQEGGLPVVVQDEPAATGVSIPVSVLVRCLEAASSRTVKLEAPPTPAKVAELLAVSPEVRVFGGLGGAMALSELRRGAAGTMTGFAFPEILRAVRLAVEAGDLAAAARVFDRYLPLIQLEAQPMIGLSIRKELLRRRGVLASAATRLAPPLDKETFAEIGDVLARVDIDPGPEPMVVEEG